MPRLDPSGARKSTARYRHTRKQASVAHAHNTRHAAHVQSRPRRREEHRRIGTQDIFVSFFSIMRCSRPVHQPHGIRPAFVMSAHRVAVISPMVIHLLP